MDEIQNKNYDLTRTTFLKKISLVMVSVLGIGYARFKNLDLPMFTEKNLNTLSEKETKNLIRKINSTESKKLKPEPPPTRI